MYLVTVTCLLDFQQMQLQAESIQQFLEPCTHYVIVNDKHIDKEVWTNMLTPYYTNHKLVLMFPDWNMYGHKSGSHSGWMKHQVYKMIISEQLDDDYVALDSKNFFIKHCNINDWQNITGSGRIENIKEYGKWIRSVDLYANYFGFKLLAREETLCSETPFVYKVNVFAKIPHMEKVFTDLYWNNGVGNECILYSYLIRDQLPRKMIPPKHITWWSYQPIEQQELDNIKNNSQIAVFGIHREFIAEADKQAIQLINEWLTSLGLVNTINVPAQEIQP